MSLIKHVTQYTTAPNQLINSMDLSFKAKGLWLFLNSKPEGWQFSIERIAKYSMEGQASVRTGLSELRKMGYLFYKARRDEETGLMNGQEYHFYDTPQIENPPVLLKTVGAEIGGAEIGPHVKGGVQNNKEYNKKERVIEPPYPLGKGERLNEDKSSLPPISDDLEERQGTSFFSYPVDSDIPVSANASRLKEPEKADILGVNRSKEGVLEGQNDDISVATSDIVVVQPNQTAKIPPKLTSEGVFNKIMSYDIGEGSKEYLRDMYEAKPKFFAKVNMVLLGQVLYSISESGLTQQETELLFELTFQRIFENNKPFTSRAVKAVVKDLLEWGAAQSVQSLNEARKHVWQVPYKPKDTRPAWEKDAEARNERELRMLEADRIVVQEFNKKKEQEKLVAKMVEKTVNVEDVKNKIDSLFTVMTEKNNKIFASFEAT